MCIRDRIEVNQLRTDWESEDPVYEDWVFAGVIDYGDLSDSGTANAYVGGHFIVTGEFKEVHR